MSFCDEDYVEGERELYVQCELIKRKDGHTYLQTSYIQAKYATAGRVLKLKQDDGTWSDGWLVCNVYCKATQAELQFAEKILRRFRRS